MTALAVAIVENPPSARRIACGHAGREAPDSATHTADAPRPISAVCGACRGLCCYHGGTHAAFVDEETLARFVASAPGCSPDDVVAAYLGYVPDHHFEGSCVYHGATGCTLPSTLRARICNEYECRGLRDAGTHKSEDQPLRLFVVSRRDNVIVHGTFVDEATSTSEGAPGPSAFVIA